MSAKSVVAVLFAHADRARELVDLLASQSIQAVVAAHPDDVLGIMNRERVDLLVIEHDLPGFLTGLEVLQRLYKDLLRPSVVLVARKSTDVVDAARQLGVSAVVAPETPLEDMVTAVRSQLSVVQTSSVSIPFAARKLARECPSIPPLPQLVLELTACLEQEDADPEQVAKDIAVDSRATADVLALVNSAAFGVAQRVSRVSDAVKFLGVRRAAAHILTASAVRSLSEFSRFLTFDERCWHNRRSVLTANAAAIFARDVARVSPDSAFVLGLLQDLGILIFYATKGNAYRLLSNHVRNVGQLRLDVAETSEFGVNHADLSAAMLYEWKLPASLVNIVHRHHDPHSDRKASKLEANLLAAMRMGEALSDTADNARAPRIQRLLQQWQTCGADAEAMRSWIAQSVAQAAESSRVLAMPLPKDGALEQLAEKLGDDAGSLPATEPVAAAAESSVETAAPAFAASEKPVEQGTAVVVVDDEAVVGDIVRRLLKPQGIEVLVARNVSEARELFQRGRAFLVDVHIGSESGVDMVEDLRRSGFKGPVIMVSGDRSRETVVSSVHAGISDYLVKPFQATVLLEKLRKHGIIPGVGQIDPFSA